MAFYQIWKFYCVWEYSSYSETLLRSKWARILKLLQENRKLEFRPRRVGQKMGRVFQVPNGKDCTTAHSTVEKMYICGENVSLLKLYVGNEGRGMASERPLSLHWHCGEFSLLAWLCSHLEAYDPLYLQFYTLISCCCPLFPNAVCSYLSQDAWTACFWVQEDTCVACGTAGDTGAKYKSKYF